MQTRITAIMLFWLLFGTAHAHAQTANEAKAFVSYKITETVKKDSCLPERREWTRSYVWIFANLANRTVIFNRNAAILNPVEHSSLDFNGSLQQMENHAFGGSGQAHDLLTLASASFGKISSDLSISLTFPKDQLKGSFVNKIDYQPGLLGLEALKLWIQSSEALDKVPTRFDSLPLISTKPPCQISGIISGNRIDLPTTAFFPQKELDFVRELRKGEELFSQGKLQESITQYEKVVNIYPDIPDGYWRLARSYFIGAEHLNPDDRAGRLKRLETAKNYATQGIIRSDMSGESWFFLTAAMGRFATTKGILNALSVTGDLERGFLAASARRPRYNFSGFTTAGDTQCGLGIYYRLVPDWWIVKVLTGTRGDINRAVSHVREALRYQPYRIEYNKELGLSLLCRGIKLKKRSDIQEGLAVLEKTLSLPNILKTDPIDKNHIQQLLVDHSKACGYSRDGFQDTSEQAFKKIREQKRN